MREATDRTTTANLLFRAYSGADLWVDDVEFSDGGIIEADTTAPTAPVALLALDTPGDSGGSVDLTWAASTDAVGVTGYKLYRGTAPGVYGAPIALLALPHLHRRHRRHRHALRPRGVGRRRCRQRVRQVARGRTRW